MISNTNFIALILIIALLGLSGFFFADWRVRRSLGMNESFKEYVKSFIKWL